MPVFDLVANSCGVGTRGRDGNSCSKVEQRGRGDFDPGLLVESARRRAGAERIAVGEASDVAVAHDQRAARLRAQPGDGGKRSLRHLKLHFHLPVHEVAVQLGDNELIGVPLDLVA